MAKQKLKKQVVVYRVEPLVNTVYDAGCSRKFAIEILEVQLRWTNPPSLHMLPARACYGVAEGPQSECGYCGIEAQGHSEKAGCVSALEVRGDSLILGRDLCAWPPCFNTLRKWLSRFSPN